MATPFRLSVAWRRRAMSCLLLLWPAIATAQDAPMNRNFPVQARIAPGVIEGVYDVETGVQRYLGIPFAQPPVGALRWKAPQPVTPWSGVRAAKAFGASPVQPVVFPDIIFRSGGMSEDCLYLNVWTPARRNSTALPVLLYFYGGGFVAGDGSEARYDGESMAAKGIVVVTTNYRLNIFGSFAHPELSAEAPYRASGNYGFLDQNAALRWVRDNIAAFGGDPERITIAGESAGSLSVSLHMASPLSRDLIAGAIGESGSMLGSTLAAVPLAEAEKQGAEFAQKAGNLSLEQLRALSTREIFELYQESKRWGFPAAIDGHVLPKPVAEIFAAGEQARVPLLVGWNSAEIPGFAFMQAPTYSKDAYIQKLKEAYPDDHETVLQLYPAGTAEEIERSATDLASDRFIAYSTWKWFEMHRRHSGGQPTYRYLYAKIPPASPPAPTRQPRPPTPEFKLIGAPHACEIPYCLGNLNLIEGMPWTEDDHKVSAVMQAAFANFIKSGNPNGQGVPEWPAAGADDPAPPVMTIDVQSQAAPSTTEARYQFHDRAAGRP
jgi:para-nitrobenzyl esterase